MANEIFIDLHNHPTIKPYGKSYSVNNSAGEENNSFDTTSNSCIWYKDHVGLIDDALKENTVGISAYTQSDFTSCRAGGVRVAVVSLYPIEKQFFQTTIDLPQKYREYIGNWISLIGTARINDILTDDFDYWEDLKIEYDYLKLLQDKLPTFGSGKYKIIASGSEIDLTETDTTFVILSIEGAHVFCEGNEVSDDELWINLESNVAFMKNPAVWPSRPFFITLAHHFYNSLCSHAQSLPDTITKFVKQDFGKDQPVEGSNYITTRGYYLIDLLYSTDNGKRILIDIKHMGKETRKEFYAYHTLKYPEIPVIYSHGGVTGESFFYDKSINIDKEDIEYIAKSNGIIGLEMDQRIMGYDALKNKLKRWWRNIFNSNEKKSKIWAEPVWKNLLYIAEHCYATHSDPWKHICLGTDYDGIINPLNAYRTADSLPTLRNRLIDFLNEYWNQNNPSIPKDTGGSSVDVIDQIMFKNALGFIQTNF